MDNPALLLHDSNLRPRCGWKRTAGLFELLAQPEMGGIRLVALVPDHEHRQLLRDVLLEIWPANVPGRYDHPADRSSGKLDDNF
jgi:protocatechuate 3,4-dioxygenase beta subunit